MKKLVLLGVLILGLVFPAVASANSGAQVYRVNLDTLNDSGVHGHATLVYRDSQLKVELVAWGLEPNMVHLQHIHGFAGTDQVATCPPMSAAGSDNILTFQEGLPFYGPVVLPLQPYPMAMKNGLVTFHETFSGVTIDDLSNFVIVLHGMTLNGTYDPTLPVACGAIMPAGS